MYTIKVFKQLFILTLIILLIPFFGSIFSKEVNWSFFDYLIGGILIHLFLTGVYFLKFANKLSKGKKVFLIVFLIVLILFWGDLAVGLFGFPWSGN